MYDEDELEVRMLEWIGKTNRVFHDLCVHSDIDIKFRDVIEAIGLPSLVSSYAAPNFATMLRKYSRLNYGIWTLLQGLNMSTGLAPTDGDRERDHYHLQHDASPVDSIELFTPTTTLRLASVLNGENSDRNNL